jgi:hypothetical protein
MLRKAQDHAMAGRAGSAGLAVVEVRDGIADGFASEPLRLDIFLCRGAGPKDRLSTV